MPVGHDPSRSWSKKPFVGSSSSCVAGVRGDGADRQPLAPGGDGLLQLVEQDLEAAEALVEEVLGLVAQAARVGLGRLHHLAGALLGGPHDLGALHHPLGLHPGRLEDLVGLAAGLGDELLALLQHPARLAQLVGQACSASSSSSMISSRSIRGDDDSGIVGAVAMMSIARRSNVSASPT